MLVTKVILRVLPWLMILSYFDTITRSNVANAKDQLLPALHIQNSDYDVIASLFYASYIVFQVPSIAVLSHLAPSRRFGVACIVLGFVGCLPGFVQNFWQFCVSRILLGLVQGGNFSGMCFIVAQWFEQNTRATAMAYVGIASSAAQISTGAIAYGVLQIKSFLGLGGWRWMFIVEGAPAILGGVLMLIFMPDGFKTAKWLTEEEKEKIKAIDESNASAAKKNEYETAFTKFRKILRIFKNWKLVMLGMGNMLNATAFSFYLYYAPSIIASLGFTDYKSSLITVPLTITNTITGITFAKLCERYNKGRWPACAILASLASASALTFLGTALNFNFSASIWIGLILLNMLQGLWFNAAYTWTTIEAAEVPDFTGLNIAFVNSLTNIGAMLGPQIQSLADIVAKSAGYGICLYIAAAFQICGSMIFITLLLLRMNRYEELRKRSKIPAPELSVNVAENDEVTKLL